MTKRLDGKDIVWQDGEALINGADAKAILNKPSIVPVETRLDGNYMILSVQSGAVEEGYKATIQSIKSEDKISLDIPDGTMDVAELETLKNGEWAKKPIYMEINAQVLGDKVVKATLSKAGLKKSEPKLL